MLIGLPFQSFNGALPGRQADAGISKSLDGNVSAKRRRALDRNAQCIHRVWQHNSRVDVTIDTLTDADFGAKLVSVQIGPDGQLNEREVKAGRSRQAAGQGRAEALKHAA